MRFCQQQANFAALVGHLPGFFQQRQCVSVVASFNEFDGLACFQLFFTWQDFLEQRTDHFFRLRTLETVHRLTVLEQIHRWDGTQAKLRGDHLLGVAVQLGENKLTVVLRDQAFQHRRQLLTVLAAFRPEIEQDRRGHRQFKGLLQVRFVNIDNILYGHGVTLYSSICFYMGADALASTQPCKILSITRPGNRRFNSMTAQVTRVTG
ncbi:hypothetical protein D3C73_1051270 [compost metagenome]